MRDYIEIKPFLERHREQPADEMLQFFGAYVRRNQTEWRVSVLTEKKKNRRYILYAVSADKTRYVVGSVEPGREEWLLTNDPVGAEETYNYWTDEYSWVRDLSR